MIASRTLILIGTLIIPVQAASAPVMSAPVKKAGSGVCHCRGDSQYAALRQFDAYPSINACLADGGREPMIERTSCGEAAEGIMDPQRIEEIFEVVRKEVDVLPWQSDVDEDCLDARSEALIGLSTVPVTYSEDGCQVLLGRWIDAYSGRVHRVATGMEIDHLVSVDYALERGAEGWPEEKLLQFANDPANLFAVSAALRDDKAGAGPTEWLPPAEERHCQYLLQFAKISQVYDLVTTRYEANSLVEMMGDKCQ